MALPDDSKEPPAETDEAIEQTPLYKKKRLLIPLFILILAVFAGSWYWYSTIRGFDSTDDAYIDGNRVSISSKMLGRIDALLAAEGDTVTVGQVLVRLDSSDLRSQALQAEAALQSAEAAVEPVRIGLEKAQDDLQRAEAEFRGGARTKEQYDHAVKGLSAAKAEYAVAQSRVSTARAQLGVVRTQLQNTGIIAPITGIVAKRWVLPGDVVQPGQPIFTVYDDRNIWVTAQFEETHLSDLRTGDSVSISVDAYSDTVFSGRVIQLGTYTASQFSLIPPNNASGNFTKVTQRIPVKISIGSGVDRKRYPLLPGMSVVVKVRTR